MEYKFSVLMSIYYKESLNNFKQAMESILKQELLPDEIVLVVDGPLPEELNIEINSYVRKNKIIKLVMLEKNMGLGEALRIGILNCSNEFVARMDTDDISKVNRFKEQIKVFKDNPDIDMVGSLIEEFREINGKINIVGVREVPKTNEEIRQKLKISNAFNHPTVMFKKSKVLLAGNYNEKFNKLEDYYLWVRMALNNCKFYNLPESLLYFRVTKETGKRRSGLKMFKTDIKFHGYLLENNFINYLEYVRNIIIWGVYRIFPRKVIEFLKNIILRSE